MEEGQRSPAGSPVEPMDIQMQMNAKTDEVSKILSYHCTRPSTPLWFSLCNMTVFCRFMGGRFEIDFYIIILRFAYRSEGTQRRL